MPWKLKRKVSMITDVQIVTMFNKPIDVSMKEIFADQTGDAEESHEK